MTTATRRVFIVTRPLKLPLLFPRQNSWPTVDSAPRITGSLDVFGLTKHWEVCVEATSGSSDNFDELFHHARYFGGVGSSLWKGGDGKLSWDLDQVRSIEAVELVGETRRSDAEIIEIGRFRWAGFFMPAGKADGADWRVARCREAAQKRVGRLSVYAAELPGLQHLSCPYRHEGRRRRVCKELHPQGSNGSLSHLPEQAGHPA